MQVSAAASTRERLRRQRPPLALEAADELLGEVLRVDRAAAVPEGVEAPAALVASRSAGARPRPATGSSSSARPEQGEVLGERARGRRQLMRDDVTGGTLVRDRRRPDDADVVAERGLHDLGAPRRPVASPRRGRARAPARAAARPCRVTPAAEDDELGLEQVHDRGEPAGERVDRLGPDGRARAGRPRARRSRRRRPSAPTPRERRFPSARPLRRHARRSTCPRRRPRGSRAGRSRGTAGRASRR